MAKFNFFKDSNKLDKLEPSDIQQKIDDKKGTIEKLEADLKKSDDFLVNVDKAHKDDIAARKQQVNEKTTQTNAELQDVDKKKKKVATKRQTVVDQGIAENKKAVKKITETKALHDIEKSKAKQKLDEKQGVVDAEVNKFKGDQDKQFIASKNELVEAVAKKKESLTVKKMKSLATQKQELDDLRVSVEQLEAKQLTEIGTLKEKLAKEVEKQTLSQDKMNQEVSNLRSNHMATLNMKKSEVEARLNQWKNEFNQYAASNAEFVERKKAELTLLNEKEKTLKETLRQKQKQIDIERATLDSEHQTQVNELSKVLSELNQTINRAQKDFEVESSLYEKEVNAFEVATGNEKNKFDQLVETLAKELADFKNSIADESLQLDARFKADCDNIVEFYRDLLGKEKARHEGQLRALEDDIRRDEQSFLVDKKAIEDKKELLENNYQETVSSIKEKIAKIHELMKDSETSHQANVLKLQQEFAKDQSAFESTLQSKQEEYDIRRQEIENEVNQATESVKKQAQKLEQVQIEVTKQTSLAESALNGLKSDFKLVETDKKQEIENLENALGELTSSFNSLQEQRRVEKVNHEQRMADLTKARQQCVNEHHAKMDEVRSLYDAKAKQVEEEFIRCKKEFEAKHQDDLATLTQDHDVKLEELNQQRAALILQHNKEKEIQETRVQQLTAELNAKIENEKSNLEAETAKFNALKTNQVNQLDQAREKFNGILSELENKISEQVAQFASQENEYKQDILAKIHHSRDEVQRLKNEESVLIKNISEIQDQFAADKNELIKSTSRYLDEHLEKVSEFESLITSKHQEVDAAQASLNELISYYVECEEEEKAKFANLEVIFAKEQQDQNHEIETSIFKLQTQKNGQLDVIRARFEAERTRILQQLDGEIQRHQQRIEDEKTALLESQAALDKEYADHGVQYGLVLDEVKKQVKQLQNDAINEEKRFKSELSRLEKSHEFDREQMQNELELKFANHNKYLEDIRIAFEQEQHEINLEKSRVANTLELKQKALDDKRIMFEDFFVKFNEEENTRRKDREQEIAHYMKNVTDLDQHIENLNNELERVKSDNQKQLDQLIAEQKQVQTDYDTLIANRSETFNLAMERIKQEHEKEVLDYTITCEAQQAELNKQNEAILQSYEKDFESYCAALNKELTDKQADIANKIMQQENALESEKTKFESIMQQLRAEEDRRVIQRTEEKAQLQQQWDRAIQEIRNRINQSVAAFESEKEVLMKENQSRIQSINNERFELENLEQSLLLTSQELDSAFEQKKREEDEKTRQFEEACFVQIADIDHVISQKNGRVLAYRDEIKQEVLKAIEERKQEEKRLEEMVLVKEQLLSEEREKIMTVIQKQQKMFEKLSAKKRAALDEEIARSNKLLERELRRIEAEKAKAGEAFALSLDELDQLILEKERNYEHMIASQKAKNEQYLKEFRQALDSNQTIEQVNDQNDLELVESLKQQLLMNEQEVVLTNKKELANLKDENHETIAKLQNNNNLVETRLNFLREQVAQLTKAVESEEDSQKHKEFFNEFEQIIQERRETLKDLENQENALRHNKLDQLTEQNDAYNQMILDHQEHILAIENEIYLEQKRLTDFEENISKRRREQKEMEIKSRNLFAQKLDYLKQRMFDN